MIDLRQRSSDAELMDGEDVSQAEFTACMADLATVNAVTMARRPTLDFIDRALRDTPPGRVLSIMDIGFGAGDMLHAIHRLAAKRGRAVRLIGVDLNPRSEMAAREAIPAHIPIELHTGDYAAWPIDDPVDLVVSSLVTHHMREEEILNFLAWMDVRAGLGWLINDLHRHWFPYFGFRLLSATMRWHPFVRHDGPVSIARAFTRADWRGLLEKAGTGKGVRISWWFPFRYCVERVKW
jgi:SAM-dependent methyltransferase